MNYGFEGDVLQILTVNIKRDSSARAATIIGKLQRSLKY